MNYKGKTTTFEFSDSLDYITRGGNGKIFHIRNFKRLDSSRINGEFVAKKFNIPKRSKNYEKRKDRFLEEINFLTNVGSQINGVVKVIDSVVDEKNNSYLYIMPFLDKYEFENDNFRDKIEKLIKIAKILKQIHNFDENKKYSHRDIKPSNIMLKDGEPILCDFGLVWDAERPKMTDDNEAVGPRAILPPELLSRELPDLDYRKSDVYLFAKLCWCYINRQEIGFPGSYFRNDIYFLESENFNVDTLEPLNEMIETCTKANLNERENIEYCIEKLEDQLSIANNLLEKDKLEHYKNKELILKFVLQNTPSIIEYLGDKNTIERLLKLIKKRTIIKIMNTYNNKQYDFLYHSYFETNGVFILLDESLQGSYKRICFSPNKIMHNPEKNSLVIKCSKINVSTIEKLEIEKDRVFVADGLTEILIKY